MSCVFLNEMYYIPIAAQFCQLETSWIPIRMITPYNSKEGDPFKPRYTFAHESMITQTLGQPRLDGSDNTHPPEILMIS